MRIGRHMRTLAHPRDRDEILQRLKRVRPNSVRAWGAMSAHQMVCHLADGLRMLTGQRAVASNATWIRRTVVKWAALYLPIRWPHGIPTSPEIHQALGGTRPADFAEDVAQVELLLDLVTAPGSRFDHRAHPVFGGMSHAAWLRWGYLHLDHHLRQFGE